VYGDERVRRGAVPKKRRLRVFEKPGPPPTVAMPTAISAIGSANVPMLAESAENADRLRASLLEADDSAATPVWLTVECPNCGERSRVEAPVQRD
jgi:hypothetical protein